MKLTELSYSKEKKVTAFHQWDPVSKKMIYVPQGFEKTERSHYAAAFKPRRIYDPTGKRHGDTSPAGKRGEGHIEGAVGDWLNLMGATRTDLPAAYAEVKKSPEFLALLKMGFTDVSSSRDAGNGTLTIQGRMEAILGSEEEGKVWRRKVLANGNIRAMASHGEHVHTYHGWRPATHHPFTIENDPHSTPVERIVKSMRQSLEQIRKHFIGAARSYFRASLKNTER